jgi:hypothetical protein
MQLPVWWNILPNALDANLLIFNELRSRRECISRTETEDRMKAAVEAVAGWVSPIAWQKFVTMTFPWNVTSETAGRKFKAMLGEMEREMRTPVAYVAAMEGRAKSGGKVPLHIHAAIAAKATISASRMEAIWTELTSRRTAQAEDGIQIKPWRDGAGGMEYILKLADTDAEWSFRWLELMNPAIRPSLNHRTIRNARRHPQDARQRIDGRAA